MSPHTCVCHVVLRLNLANDAADMRESDDEAEKRDIYSNVSKRRLFHTTNRVTVELPSDAVLFLSF